MDKKMERTEEKHQNGTKVTYRLLKQWSKPTTQKLPNKSLYLSTLFITLARSLTNSKMAQKTVKFLENSEKIILIAKTKMK